MSLIATASKLLQGAATDDDIKRSVSTVYYAIFHHLCQMHCDLLVDDDTLGAARYQAYRSVDHSNVKAACQECKAAGKGFPKGIIRYAETFIWLQDLRHDADYNPTAEFDLKHVTDLINSCINAIAAFDAEPERHRRAFVLFVALKRRSK
jgi:uncharacterized protein (UPF0332 family)